MDRFRKATLITLQIQLLADQDIKCSKRRIQKLIYYLQELMNVPMGFNFILYKHAPYSFDLNYELTGLRADGVIRLETQWEYVPYMVVTKQGQYIQDHFPKTLKKYEASIEFITAEFGNRSIEELERLTSALYVTHHKTDSGAAIEDRSKKLTTLKPHIPDDLALRAMRESDRIAKVAHSYRQSVVA